MLTFAALPKERLIPFPLFDKKKSNWHLGIVVRQLKPDSGLCARFDSDLEEQPLLGLSKMLEAPYLIPLSAFQNCCRG